MEKEMRTLKELELLRKFKYQVSECAIEYGFIQVHYDILNELESDLHDLDEVNKEERE
jgi:hypothetical protein